MYVCICGQCQCWRGDSPWLVPMRIALPFSLHFKTKGVKSSSILITSSSYSSYHGQQVVSDEGLTLPNDGRGRTHKDKGIYRHESTPQCIVQPDVHSI